MAVGTYALTSLANLKAFKGISVTTNDTLLENCIDRITELFENFTNRKLKARDYSYDSGSGDYDSDNAIVDGNGIDRMPLPQYPVNSITTLRINELAIDERSSIYDTGWVLADKAAGIVILSGYIFTAGIRNIELVYNGGFSTIPEDLEQACIEQAAWLFKQSAPGGNLLGVTSKALADGSISYSAKDLLASVRLVLERYKKRFAL